MNEDKLPPGYMKRIFREGPKEDFRKKKKKLQQILEDISKDTTPPNYDPILGEW